LTGTAGPAVGRFVICAKSPATGLWGESNVGGFFGPELRAAGWDGLWVEGRSERPVYLWIHDGGVELRPAEALWGRADTYETQDRIRQEVGERGARVASIGAAGEAGIPFAAILCDHGRMAGRTGMGAVMGSKNLKAVAVRGRRAIPVADPALFAATRRRSNVGLAGDTVTRALRTGGSASAAEYFDYLGIMPKRYFTRGESATAHVASGAEMAETILSGVSACHACVIACGRKVRLEDGVERKGPEYETLVGFGPNLEIGDRGAIVRLSELCDRYGMDTISLSNTIGLAFFLFQEGRLTESDTGGLRLVWGDASVVETLIHQTARREGLGRMLSEGARSLAIHFGDPEAAAQVNGLELAYHDPRGASGMALVYTTSPRGACHNQGDYYMVEIGQVLDEVGIGLLDRQGGPEKAANVARHQNWRTLGNALVLCQFANVPPEDVVSLLAQATGFDYTLDDLLASGERGWTLKRAINCRLGLTAKNDRLPGHFDRALPDGPSAGVVPPYDAMLKAYYQVRGWDPLTGRPSPEKLSSLGLREIASDLWEDRYGPPVGAGSTN
jgi:aldehyde:ferredoxin oxidoreductase